VSKPARLQGHQASVYGESGLASVYGESGLYFGIIDCSRAVIDCSRAVIDCSRAGQG